MVVSLWVWLQDGEMYLVLQDKWCLWEGRHLDRTFLVGLIGDAVSWISCAETVVIFRGSSQVDE